MKSYICDKSITPMMKRKFLLICLFISVLCSSCITNKDVVYLQDKGTINKDSLLKIKDLKSNLRAKPKVIFNNFLMEHFVSKHRNYQMIFGRTLEANFQKVIKKR